MNELQQRTPPTEQQLADEAAQDSVEVMQREWAAEKSNHPPQCFEAVHSVLRADVYAAKVQAGFVGGADAYIHVTDPHDPVHRPRGLMLCVNVALPVTSSETAKNVAIDRLSEFVERLKGAK